MGTIEEPDQVLRWQHGGDLRSIYLREGRIIGAQLAGDIRAAGVYRSLMMRRSQVTCFGQRLVEPGFGMADVISDALKVGVPSTVSG
jgi:NAD(P)H-nitrite reductase large subunit